MIREFREGNRDVLNTPSQETRDLAMDSNNNPNQAYSFYEKFVE